MNKPVIFIFTLLLILGCSRPAKYSDILNRANELINSNPDSVAKLLDLIDAPEKLPPPAKADYGYFKSLAHSKTDKAMADDSLILFTLDYYKMNNNTGKLSRTYQFVTSHFMWKNDMTSAKETAQEDLQYNTELNDREIQLCCILCAEFSTKEISVVTQQSVRTIYQRKTTIRQKLGMDEKDDIVDFLNKKIPESKPTI